MLTEGDAVHCDNCGAAVLPGHRFCRSCGRATDDYAEEGTPTQMMPPEPPPVRGSRDTATATPSRVNTNPVYTPPQQQQTQQPNYYQQQHYAPIQPPQPMPPHYTPTRSRSPWGWIVAAIAIVLIVAVALGVVIFNDSPPPGRPPREASGPPPLPPPPPGSTITRTFPFAAKGGNLTLETLSGDVTIEGWDEPRAEVRITKSGNTEVRDSSDGSNLILRTEPRGGDGGDVKYEIKLPRNAGRVEIRAVNSDIALSDFTGNVQINNDNGSVTMSDMNGDIKVNMANGDINFTDVQGVLWVNTASGTIEMLDVNGKISANSVSGDISVSFAGENLEPLSVNTVSGDIEVTFDSDVNADLTVKTLTGDIEVDESLGIEVRETPVVGKEARGRIGAGGQSIKINTTAGDVRIQKQ
jgi:hypothetical protein